MTKIICVVGTRPEAIKMAPVIRALKAEPWADTRVLATAQHRDTLDQALRLFHITPDIDLDIMRPNQSLPSLTARLLEALSPVLRAEKPDAVLTQGDTATVMTVALACFYQRIPIGHVESGLRTGDTANPFPEEINRIVADQLARWHFVPTESARRNLLREGFTDADIVVTGNTVIDALLDVVGKNPRPAAGDKHSGAQDAKRRTVLITAHRRESFGAPLRNICRALVRLSRANPQTLFLYPVHPNPNVENIVRKILGALPNVSLSEPLDYADFVAAMQDAHIILTDSGGVQEEAPALAKPVLVLRDKTERPEAVAAGVAKLVGSDTERIVMETQKLLDDEAAWRAMAEGASPYGDGRAAGRIVATLRARFAPAERKFGT